MNKDLHFSSASSEWATPQDFFDRLDREFQLKLDVCATPENAKCARFFTKSQDGLKRAWTGRCWMNPPYGDPQHPCKNNCQKRLCVKRGHHSIEYVPGIRDWVRKAYESSLAGATVVCLVPVRTDTSWFQDYCLSHAAEIRFVRGRLKFGGHQNGAPFPSAVVVFRPGHDGPPLVTATLATSPTEAFDAT